MKNVIELILTGNSSRLLNALGTGERGLKRFGSAARQEFDRIRNAARSLEGRLASLGIGVGAAMLVKQSAKMDKSLTQIGQTAGVSRTKVAGLRTELFRMAKDTGQNVEDLQQGFNNAVQAGLNFGEALPVLDATSRAMAVTGANADRLTSGLTVAATAFQFDLAKPKMALNLLDKMTVAGRLGNAELENLSDIFARVGVNASRAGMGFDHTLAFIEGLSLIEKSPERLSTLADSSLRLFTNLQYMKVAQSKSGVRFFNEKGARRNPLEILADLKKKYDAFKTDQQRELFMGSVLKGADIDTVKGIQTLLKGDMLAKVSSEFLEKISEAGGTLDKDFKEAIRNAVDQTGRLKAAMRQAADDFIKPLDAGITKVIKKLLDKKEEGGWELSGGQIAAGGAAALLTTYLGGRFGGPMAKKLLGRLGGTATGIAEGKVIEAATGVTPVFVTNWPGSGFNNPFDRVLPKGSGNNMWKKIKSFGGTVTGRALGAVGAGIGIAELTSMFMPNAAYSGPGATGRMLADWFEGLQKVPFKDSVEYKNWLHNKAENIINLSITIDKNGRAVSNIDDMSTKLNLLPRGKF